MQFIEADIFPHLNKKKKNELQDAAEELVRYATEMPTVNEDFDFDDNNIFDAIMEQLYRITALGISGFDSQMAFNSLPECKSSLNSLQYVLHFYKDEFEKKLPGKFATLDSTLAGAQNYFEANNNFNSFNRMKFIQKYLNPITTVVGEYKTANNYKDNPASLYYSAIKKNNTLFASSAFNPYQ